MTSFWALRTIDKCAVLACLVQTLSQARMTSLQMLAEARGETVEAVWERCCQQAGVQPCSVPQHLFGAIEPPREIRNTVVDIPREVPRDTAGFAARTKLLEELARAQAFQTRRLRAHASRA